MDRPPIDGSTGDDPIGGLIHALHEAGWTAGIRPVADSDGPGHWLVIARNGEVRIIASAETRHEAWQKAADRARSMGMLRG